MVAVSIELLKTHTATLKYIQSPNQCCNIGMCTFWRKKVPGKQCKHFEWWGDRGSIYQSNLIWDFKLVYFVDSCVKYKKKRKHGRSKLLIVLCRLLRVVSLSFSLHFFSKSKHPSAAGGTLFDEQTFSLPKIFKVQKRVISSPLPFLYFVQKRLAQLSSLSEIINDGFWKHIKKKHKKIIMTIFCWIFSYSFCAEK